MSCQCFVIFCLSMDEACQLWLDIARMWWNLQRQMLHRVLWVLWWSRVLPCLCLFESGGLRVAWRGDATDIIMIWCDVIWCDVMWYDMIWYDWTTNPVDSGMEKDHVYIYIDRFGNIMNPSFTAHHKVSVDGGFTWTCLACKGGSGYNPQLSKRLLHQSFCGEKNIWKFWKFEKFMLSWEGGFCWSPVFWEGLSLERMEKIHLYPWHPTPPKAWSDSGGSWTRTNHEAILPTKPRKWQLFLLFMFLSGWWFHVFYMYIFVSLSLFGEMIQFD